MNVIPFLRRNEIATPKQLHSFTDLVCSDKELEARTAELLPQAFEAIDKFPAQAIAEMLAYSAARLERSGFKVFRI